MMQTAGIPFTRSFHSAAPNLRSRRKSAGTVSLRLIQNLAIGTIIFLGGFVIFEPAPYELVLIATLVTWLALGLRIPRGVLPPLLLFSTFCAGGILASFQMTDHIAGYIYVAVTYFLALASVFFAIIIAKDASRLQLIFKVYVASAVASTMLGILGYFGMPGFEIFTKFSRAAGAFQDPNVFGPFLTAPILYVVYCLLTQPFRRVVPLSIIMGILALGLFLAFSRAAWGLTAFSLLMFYALLFINERQPKIRLKYVALAIAGAVMLILTFIMILQIDAISSLFLERAKIVQDYDGGKLGRFERHILGFKMALEHPLGLGPREFVRYYVEDTHNIYLRSLLAYGWVGCISWLTITFWTLIAGFKLLFRPRPWQVFLQIAYVVFAGHCIVGIVIDTDHWRHFYLMFGIIWGCILLEQNWQSSKRASHRKAHKEGPNDMAPIQARPARPTIFEQVRPSIEPQSTS